MPSLKQRVFRLRSLLEKVEENLPVDEPKSTEEKKRLDKVIELVDSIAEVPELDKLTQEELHAFKNFRTILHHARYMTDPTMKKHILAQWWGRADQVMRKLPKGDQIVKLMQTFELE